MPFRSIRAKLLALFLLAAVLPILIVSIVSYANSLRSVETMVGNRIEEMAQTVAGEVSGRVGRRVEDRILVVNRPVQDLLQAYRAGNRDAAFEALRDLDLYMPTLFREYAAYYSDLVLADSLGNPLVRYNRSQGASGSDSLLVGAPGAPASPGDPGVSTAPPPLKRSVVGDFAEPAPDTEDPAERYARDLVKMRVNWKKLLGDNIKEMDARDIRETVRELHELGRMVSEMKKLEIQLDLEDDKRKPPITARFPIIAPGAVAEFSERIEQAALRGRDLDRGEFLFFSDRSDDDEDVLRLVRPIHDVEDPSRRLGILIADVRRDYVFPEDLMAQHFGSEGELGVVNRASGEVLFHTRPDRVGQSIGRVDPGLAEALLRTGRDRDPDPFQKVSGGEAPRLASILSLNDVGWQVVATAVPREFASEARDAAVLNLLLALIILGLAGTILVYASNRVSRSIQTVTQGANEIAAGNLSHSIQVQTHDEIQTLGETFNVMTQSLRENIALKEKAARELELLNRSLEDRVRERTAELESLNRILNQANQELKELDRLKTNFLSTVSHEFRTPLTSITAFSEILLDELDTSQGPPETHRFLGIIHSESERLGRLIKNLLDLSRIESGRIVWERERFPVQDAIEAALAGLLPVFQEKQIEVHRDLQCPLAVIEADRDRIQQVVTNLCENAVKFSEKRQRLWVSCMPDADTATNGQRRVEIRIRDEGSGIPADHLESIFERFSQVDNSETRAAGGTGLGLAISREIVEHHGGRIWAESERGRGAVFRLTLPVLEEEDRSPETAARVEAAPGEDHG